MKFISDDGGETYNNCHCESSPPPPHLAAFADVHAVWSNFEIGDLDFWRGEAYSKFFDFLDEKGGFYYEVRRSACRQTGSMWLTFAQRWGDAPVHSIGAALFAKKEQIHFFNDIGLC